MSPTNGLSILLIILTPITYLPQYHRMLTVRSSAGLSIAATCLSTLVAQSQVVNMYYLFKSAPDMREGVPIATPPSTRDWLNLTQILVQWCCSLLCYVLVVVLPATATTAATTDNNSTSSVTNTGTTTAATTATSKAIPTSLLVLHALLFLVSIPVGGRAQDIIFNIIRNINSGIATPLFTLCAVAAFIVQALATWRAPQESDALSKPTLILQIFVFLLLAILWPFRLILPQNMWLYYERAVLTAWYPWVGWACVNNAVVAVGQAVVLYVAWQGRGGSSAPLAGERQPLLAT